MLINEIVDHLFHQHNLVQHLICSELYYLNLHFSNNEMLSVIRRQCVDISKMHKLFLITMFPILEIV